MITTHSVEQGTPEWLALRSGKYTGSSAHKLLRYGATPDALTELSEFEGNFYTKRGHILEDEAIELYERITQTAVERPGFITNDRFPACGYSPDGIQPNHLVEVKCFNEKRHRAMLAEEIPLTVLAQIHFGMLICEKRAAVLLIYNPDLDVKEAFRAISIPFNQAIQDNFTRILSRKGASSATN